MVMHACSAEAELLRHAGVEVWQMNETGATLRALVALGRRARDEFLVLSKADLVRASDGPAPGTIPDVEGHTLL